MTDDEIIHRMTMRLDSLAYVLERTHGIVRTWGTKEAGDLMERYAHDTRQLLAEVQERRTRASGADSGGGE